MKLRRSARRSSSRHERFSHPGVCHAVIGGDDTVRTVRLLVVVVLAAGCAGGSVVVGPVAELVTPTSVPIATQEPTQTPATVVPTTPAPEPTTAEQPRNTGTDSPFFSAGADGLITSTGVPVAVLTRTSDSFVVRTPCGLTDTVKTAASLIEAIEIVLDPGHGGPVDTGAVGPNGLVERDLNLDVAFATQADLERRGFSVVLTRTADYETTLATRSALADDLGAALMVSIHHNAPTPGFSATPGPEVFVQNTSPESARLGGLVWTELVNHLSVFSDVEWGAAFDAGVMSVLNSDGFDAYGMIRRPATVTVLAELGYISNRSEAELMATPRYVSVAAAALAEAIERYLRSDAATGRAVNSEPRVFNPNASPVSNDCTDPPLE